MPNQTQQILNIFDYIKDMPRPLRDTKPNKLHLLSCRTIRSELLFVPCSKLNNIIGGILAKYSSRYSINLYAACVLSNHYHIIADSPIEGNISLFEENINKEISKRVNRFLNRTGSIWERRYDDLLVLEKEDALEALIYTVTNPTKHGLVANPSSWPGITSCNPGSNLKTKTYTFFNYTEYNKAKRKAASTAEVVRKSDYEQEYKLEIKKLPQYKELSNEAYENLIEKEVKKRTRKLQEERWSKKQKFLGRKAVLNQSRTGVFPRKTNKTKRPACYTRCKRALAEFIEELKLIREKYNLASIKYRLGQTDYEFPIYCYFPPRHHTPKYVPS